MMFNAESVETLIALRGIEPAGREGIAHLICPFDFWWGGEEAGKIHTIKPLYLVVRNGEPLPRIVIYPSIIQPYPGQRQSSPYIYIRKRTHHILHQPLLSAARVEMTTNGPKESINGGTAWYRCDPPMNLGEAPIYRATDSTLHWVDCLCEPPELHILKVEPETGDAQGRARVLILEDSVTVAFFRRNHPGSYICAYYQGVAFLDEATGKLDVVKEIIPTSQRDLLRFNDGGVDAKGRFWLAEIDKKAMAYGPNKLPSSYGEPKGRLWRYDPDGSLHEMEKGIVCGNGLAWSPDNKTSENRPHSCPQSSRFL